MGLFTESLGMTDLQLMNYVLTRFGIKCEQRYIKEPLKEEIKGSRRVERTSTGGCVWMWDEVEVLPEYIRIDSDPPGHTTISFYFDMNGKYHSCSGYET